jgi:hypothetical protein
MLPLMSYHRRPALQQHTLIFNSWRFRDHAYVLRRGKPNRSRHAGVNGGGSHRFRRPRSPTDMVRSHHVVFRTADRMLNLPADEMVDFCQCFPPKLSIYIIFISTSFYRKYKSVNFYPKFKHLPLTINIQNIYKLAT